MPKITYLLGAGASAQALPTIAKNNYNEGLSQSLVHFVANWAVNGYDKVRVEGSNSVDWLTEKCMKFKTPDLFAKYLLETGQDQNYKRLKTLISMYFQEAQKSKDKYEGLIDFRALQFLVTLTENKKLPSNVNIISWNYDMQIELAAKSLLLDHDKGFASWPNIPNPKYNGDYFLLHLNGVAGYSYCDKNLIEPMITNYNLDQDFDPLLSFAWEDENTGIMNTFFKNRIKKMQEMILNTEILVIIGYSFPFFNRNMDKILMQTMDNNLRKIYYQDPIRDGSFLIEQFNLEPVDITHISDVEQYYIPYEL